MAIEFTKPQLINQVIGYQKVVKRKMRDFLREMPDLKTTSTNREIYALDSFMYNPYPLKEITHHYDLLKKAVEKLYRFEGDKKPFVPFSEKSKTKKTLSASNYKRPGQMQVMGNYLFVTNGQNYAIKTNLFEKYSNTEDQIEIQDKLRPILGAIIIKNNAWAKLSKGQTVMARTRSGKKGKLTKLIN
jgi:hypothetical protein